MKVLKEQKANSFFGKMQYQYIETGYEDKDYAEVYDLEIRTIPVCIYLPDEKGSNYLKFNFRTPDEKFEESITINLESLESYRDNQMIFKAVLNNFNISNNTIEFMGNFVFEFINEDGFHVFNMTLIFEENQLIKNLFEAPYLMINK